MIGNMPMSTLASFGMSLDHDALDRVVQQWQHDVSTSTHQNGSTTS